MNEIKNSCIPSLDSQLIETKIEQHNNIIESALLFHFNPKQAKNRTDFESDGPANCKLISKLLFTRFFLAIFNWNFSWFSFKLWFFNFEKFIVRFTNWLNWYFGWLSSAHMILCE